MARKDACSCGLKLEDETWSHEAAGLKDPLRRRGHLLSAMEEQNRGGTIRVSWALFVMVSMRKCPVC